MFNRVIGTLNVTTMSSLSSFSFYVLIIHNDQNPGSKQLQNEYELEITLESFNTSSSVAISTEANMELSSILYKEMVSENKF